MIAENKWSSSCRTKLAQCLTRSANLCWENHRKEAALRLPPAPFSQGTTRQVILFRRETCLGTDYPKDSRSMFTPRNGSIVRCQHWWLIVPPRHKNILLDAFIQRWGIPASRLTLSGSVLKLMLQYFLYWKCKYRGESLQIAMLNGRWQRPVSVSHEVK